MLCVFYCCRFLTELESPSWWPFGKLPWKTQQEARSEDAAKAAATASAAPSRASGRNRLITSIPAIVSKSGHSDLKPGCLLVHVSSLEVQDKSFQLLHRFDRNEVDEIKVHSPYEITVRQRFIGKPDICWRLLSAKMPEALSVLEIQYKKKMEFMCEYRTTPASSPCDLESPDGHKGKVRIV